MFQLLTARCLHQYHLPDGWTIVAAISPETPDYDVNPLDSALRARFLRVIVHADRAAWLEWASANGIHPAILRLAHEQDQIFADVPPRTWTKASSLLVAMTPEQRRDPEFVRDVLGGTLPPPGSSSCSRRDCSGARTAASTRAPCWSATTATRAFPASPKRPPR